MAEKSGIPSDYWIAAATVLPIIALGIMAEARESVRRWRERPGQPPGWFRLLLSLLWLVYLLLAAFSVPASLRALRGEHVADYWPRLIEFTTMQGLSVVTITPMLELIMQSVWVVKAFTVLIMPVRLYRKVRLVADISRSEDLLSRQRYRILGNLTEALIVESKTLRILSRSNLTTGERAEAVEMQEKVAQIKSDVIESLKKVDSTLAGFPEFRRRIENATTLKQTMRLAVEFLGEEAW